jgi:uncharacterized membrane protein
MTDKQFDISDVLAFGWKTMTANILFFIPVTFILLFLNHVTNIAQHVVPDRGPLFIPMIYIISTIISFVVNIGMIKIVLAFIDNKKPSFTTLFAAKGCFWRYVAACILYMLITAAGTILLIVPGIIWSVKFSLVHYFVVDKNMGPIDALKASAKATQGAKWHLFGFGFVCMLFIIGGFLCLVVGIFAAYPTILVAAALIYRQLAAQTPELAPATVTNDPNQQNEII